ncbi:MAG: UDP-3-O-(3-hydroxymyristoyl)glucosamine N-acyltransferase, partial [Halioglobus sp.]|nr:UDP-3-O-(3-hydroxymyristoyl)glucosamine N-acyltransferase [Halioglobus sp.]
MYTLGDLADRLGLSFAGDAQRALTGLAPLAAAGPGELTFLADRKYLAQLGATRAGAVIVHPDFAAQCPVDSLISDAPYLSFARASQLFDR